MRKNKNKTLLRWRQVYTHLEWYDAFNDNTSFYLQYISEINKLYNWIKSDIYFDVPYIGNRIKVTNASPLLYKPLT